MIVKSMKPKNKNSEIYITGLQCLICKHEYEPFEVEYVCPNHGYEGRLDVLYDYEGIKEIWEKKQLQSDANHTMWRYQPVLPVKPDNITQFLPVGGTPLFHAKKLGKKLGVNHLYLKCDLFNPTASLKDRASIVAVIRAMEKKQSVITAASCGNAAASLAGMTAAVSGMHSVLFVPKTAPKEKITQINVYGAIVFLVNDTYDAAFDLCLKASDTFGWYSRNTGYNPYLSEGKKTVMLEVCEQLHWQVPDHVFVAVGDGCIIGSLGKAIRDLIMLGWISNTPRIYGVEAQGAAALYNAWKQGNEQIIPVIPRTIADSIAVSAPRDSLKAFRTVRESNGEFLAISDTNILQAMKLLAQTSGIFAEPAGATGLAGAISMINEGKIDTNDTIVVLVTGSGLKDTQHAAIIPSQQIIIEPSLDALQKELPAIEQLRIP